VSESVVGSREGDHGSIEDAGARENGVQGF